MISFKIFITFGFDLFIVIFMNLVLKDISMTQYD